MTHHLTFVVFTCGFLFSQHAEAVVITELKIIVKNQNSIACEKPVQVPIDGIHNDYCLLDANGIEVDFQIDTLDVNCPHKELVFLSKNEPGQSRVYYFCSSALGEKRHQLPVLFTVSQELMGSWVPIHIPPTISVLTGQQMPNLSDENKASTLKLLSSLRDEREVLRVNSPAMEIVFGLKSGLIEAMKPKAVIFGGSYLREFSPLLPNSEKTGDLRVVSQGPVRVVLAYKSDKLNRHIYIYRNGIIATINTGKPQDFQIITSCYPYPYSSTSVGDNGVRFSQVIEQEYDLANAYCLYLYHPAKTGLGISFFGSRPIKETIWADGGELAYEVGLQTIPPDMSGFSRYLKDMVKLCRPVIGGMIRLNNIKIERELFDITYLIENNAADCNRFFADLKHFDVRTKKVDKAEIPAISAAVQKQDKLICEIIPVTDKVTRLYPNEGYGWKLRPFILSSKNPLSASYDLVLTNRAEKTTDIRIMLPAADWIEQVKFRAVGEEDMELAKDIHAKQFMEKKNGEYAARLTIGSHEKKVFSLKIQPKEETLGRYDMNLLIQADASEKKCPFSLTIVPNIPIFSYTGEVPRDWWIGREFGLNAVAGFTGPRNSTTINMDGTVNKKFKDKLTDFYVDAEKRGLFIFDNLDLRSHVRFCTKKSEQQMPSFPDPVMGKMFEMSGKTFADFIGKQFITNIEDFAKDCHIAYWGHDEIWEVLSSGRCTIEDVAFADEAVINNTIHPLMHTIMEPGINDNLHKILPMDIPATFYYSGIDDGVHKYADKLRNGYEEIFNSWKKDPNLASRLKDKDATPLCWFWISGQQHVSDYITMRRQAWWLRYNGYNGLGYWAFCTGQVLYANGVGGFTVMFTEKKNDFVLTDRAFAMIDIEQDMALITELKIRKNEIKDKELLGNVQLYEDKAYSLSQQNCFDLAAWNIKKAVSLCKKEAEFPVLNIPAARPLSKMQPERKILSAAKDAAKLVVPKVKPAQRPAPVIDGELDNSFLEDGRKIGQFILISGRDFPANQTEVYLIYDDMNLYLFFLCHEKEMERIKTNHHTRDSELWQDDCVEIFISPDANENYFHLIVNAEGAKYDRRIPGIKGLQWNPSWQAQTKKFANYWTVEIAMPFSSLEAKSPQKEQKWKANFCRAEPGLNEYSSWSPCFGDFHNINVFGEITFSN